MPPTSHYFLTDPKGSFWLGEEYPLTESCTLLQALRWNYDNCTIYDSTGFKWRPNGVEKPLSKWWWLLVPLTVFYSPRFTLNQLWHEPIEYTIEELKAAFIAAVDMDDDSLTQFVAAEDLKKRILESQSFHDLVEVYEWMQIDHFPEWPHDPPSTLDDLYRTEGHAELIAGRIVRLPASGYKPSRVAARILRSLDDFVNETDGCEAFSSKVAYAVPVLASGRESFSPDASVFCGPLPSNEMRFLEGPPWLAVEVRSEDEYTEAAEVALANKRADYFEAGTSVVWDVDPVNDRIRKFTSSQPRHPVIFSAGQEADAEPAIRSWKISVDQIFREPSDR